MLMERIYNVNIRFKDEEIIMEKVEDVGSIHDIHIDDMLYSINFYLDVDYFHIDFDNYMNNVNNIDVIQVNYVHGINMDFDVFDFDVDLVVDVDINGLVHDSKLL